MTAASTDAGKKPRADAVRNRDKLVDAARAAFAAAGDDSASLEGIARSAGVGIGTLYRHFPSREALVEAVYAAELDHLTDTTAELLRELPPDRALRAWMGRYAVFVATKRGMADTLRAGWASGRIATPDTRGRITAAIAEFLTAASVDGSLRTDVEADDVVTMMLGILLATATDDAAKTARMLDLAMAALRPEPTGRH
ncbi:TetR/AcrR family transcriptional regulator [Nocardia sp. NBC_00511]|uniref:TetR/AcrR family transcriptional regulator n=1 Tax=Nocardia sp. NBC_00511 TaxID=2903591 RepID=UPI0030DFC03D